MTTATMTRTPARTEPGHTLTGTATLVRFALRRDRVRLLVWIASLVLLTVYTAIALETVYPTTADRQARAELMRSPAAVMLGGPSFGLDDYTLGAMLANELGLTLMLAVAILSIQTVVRHTRAEEETGRAELVRAGVLGRYAQVTAALITAALANTVVAVLVAAGLAAGGLPVVDSFGFTVGVALVGLVFAAVAAVTAQVSEHARASTGIALAVLGAAAVVRGVGDIMEPGGSPLSWFSPIAWAQQTRVYVELRWWPLLLAVATIAAGVWLAYLLAERRDVGAGLTRPRPGRADASPALSGPAALAARLQRGAVAGWAVGLFLLGITFGSLTQAVTDMAEENPDLAAMFGPDAAADMSNVFYGVMTIYVALGVGAYAVASVLRLRSEETAGRAEPMLATALSRWRWMGGGLLVTLAGSVVLLVVGGLGMGVSAAAVVGDAGLIGTLTGAALAYLPAVLLVAGVAAALFGLAPRAAGLTWVVVLYAVVVGTFGELLGLPQWAIDLSPFGLVPTVPGDDLELAPLALLTVVAAAMVAAGLTGFRRRDLTT